MLHTAIHTISTPVLNMTYAIHEFSYACNVPACRTLRIFSRRLYGRKLIGCQFEERRRDIMTFHRHVKKATGHVKVVVARELQINRRDKGGCCSGHRTARYCRQNFTLGHQHWTRIPTVHQDKEDAEVDRPYLKSLSTLILSFQTYHALGGPGIESRCG